MDVFKHDRRSAPAEQHNDYHGQYYDHGDRDNYDHGCNYDHNYDNHDDFKQPFPDRHPLL